MQVSGMLSEPQARFLASRRVGHLATADARAIPHLVPVCFVVSEGALYITIDQKPKGDVRALKRLRNIIENPVAAFVADRWDEDWTRLGWVMLRGPAEILADGAEHDRAQALLRSRYRQYHGMETRRPPGHRHPHRAGDKLGNLSHSLGPRRWSRCAHNSAFAYCRAFKG